MSVSFTNVPVVSPGQAILAEQWNKLALGVNDRMVSGIGDPSWRIFYYLLSALRQMIFADDGSGGNLSPEDDALRYLVHIAANSGVVWPDPATSVFNPANFLNGFIFGNDLVDSEDLRINMSVATGSPSANWALGKGQRGAVDPSNGDFNCPVFDAAKAAFGLATNYLSRDGQSWGGFQAGPPFIGLCVDGVTPEFTFLFTAIPPNTGTQTFSTCNHFVEYGPFDYTVVEFGFAGTPPHQVIISKTVLSRNLWIEGPYTTGAGLQHADAGFVGRAVAWFNHNFRGEPKPATVKTDLTKVFDFERFYKSQYLLAPQRGTSSGSVVTAVYPLFQLSGSMSYAAGTFLPLITPGTGGTVHQYATGYVLTQVFVSASGLTPGQVVGLYLWDTRVGTVLIQTLNLTADEGGAIGAVVAIGGSQGSAGASPYLSVQLVGALASASVISLAVECTELYPYKPWEQDAYLLLRLGSSTPGGPAGGNLDGSGTVTADASTISTSYFANGCILGQQLAAQTSQTNTNGVYEAVRRATEHCVREVTRDLLVAYEVDGGGNSVVWFKRFAQGDALADAFAGIGPTQVLSGLVVAGVVYRVVLGSVVYPPTGQPGSATRGAGTTFTGVDGQNAWDVGGTGRVYVEGENGIVNTLPSGPGETNEWMMWASGHVYNWSVASAWKPSVFADYHPIPDRCFWWASAGTGNGLPRDFGLMADGVNQLVNLPLGNPENPSGYRYVHGTNQNIGGTHGWTSAAQKAFYKSCQIYEPDSVMTSCTLDVALTATFNTPVVKCVFAGRFQFCDASTAGTVAMGGINPIGIPGSWATLPPAGEPYRTRENLIREYLVWAATGFSGGGVGGTGDCSQKISGDTAANSGALDGMGGGSQGVNGACFPTFVFTSLVRKFGHGTPIKENEIRRAELYIRAMCEGFVDGATTVSLACGADVPQLYDFSFEQLCFQAFGLPYFGLSNAANRPDNPGGHGPMPGTVMSFGGTNGSEMFNRFAKAVNLMTKARVMLPMQVTCQTVTTQGVTSSVPWIWSRVWDPVLGPNYVCAKVGGDPAPSNGVAVEGYSAATGSCVTDPGSSQVCISEGVVVEDLGASKSAQVAGCYDTGGPGAPPGCLAGTGTNFQMLSFETQTSYSLGLIDPDALNAVPVAWRDMIGTLAVGWYATVTKETSGTKLVRVATGPEADDCPPGGGSGNHALFGGGVSGAWGYHITIVGGTESVCAQMAGSGTVVADAIPVSDYVYAEATPGVGQCDAGAASSTSIVPIGSGDLSGLGFVEVPLV